MSAVHDPTVPDRNLALELVRVTEAAAMGAAGWIGRGDKNAADGAAVDMMRRMINTVTMQGVVVIGEGEKDEAPMLFNGERVGAGFGPEVDVAVDPLEGTRLTAFGIPGLDLGHRRRRAEDDVLPRRGGLHGEDRRRPRGRRRDRPQALADRECPGGRRREGDAGDGPHRRRARARAP